MAGWLHKGGQPLTVVAVERAPANLLIVRERSDALLAGLAHVFEQYELAHSRQPPVPIRVVDDGDRVRFVYPTQGSDRVLVGRGAAPIGIEQMPVSRDASGFGPLFGIVTRGFTEEDSPLPRQQLTDAVAIAGMVAASGDQRRAVLLIHSGATEDSSRFAPASVRGYLEQLGVPLVVWSFPAEGDAASLWDGARDVSQLRLMNRALDDLRKVLKSQVVVWVEGAHLSHEIELTDRAKGLHRAG